LGRKSLHPRAPFRIQETVMAHPLVPRATAATRPLTLLTRAGLQTWLAAQPAAQRQWVEAMGFAAKPGEICVLPGAGGPAGVLAGVHDEALGGLDDLWAVAGLTMRLPAGTYRLDPEPEAKAATRAALGWALGAYAFTRYKPRRAKPATLVWPKAADADHATRMADAVFLVRDLVNTPAEDMGPDRLAAVAKEIAAAARAKIEITVGDRLAKRNYPLIHAVGRAAAVPPRLIDITWGNRAHPKVTLVGKGVCFDSGGLDIKPAEAMKLMKKDMGGAAHALALGRLIMQAKLKVRLRVLVPAVENAVAGNAFRPFDVYRSRKGITVEIGNTDAEGRLILADALAEASGDKPALLIDFATLTGAARVALGPDLPAMYCTDDGLADALMGHARAEVDPMWRLPLWPGYRAKLESKTAEISSTGEGGMAGSITAALFLKEFVEPGIPWIHFDMYSWTTPGRPGRPEGGAAQTLRALFALLSARYGSAVSG